MQTTATDRNNALIHDMRKRKRDLLSRINYATITVTVLLPLLAIVYMFHKKLGAVPSNQRTLCFSVAYFHFTMLAFTAGYHKCYAHLTFRPRSGLLQAYFCIFGASLGFGPARHWAGLHRAHHQFTDDPEKDPHSIKRGFVWAHFGWLLKRPRSTMFYAEFIEKEFPKDKSTVLGDKNHPTQTMTEGQQESLIPGNNEVLLEPHATSLYLQSEPDSDAPHTKEGLDPASWILWQERWAWVFFLVASIVIPMAVSVWWCDDSLANGLLYPGIIRMFLCQQSALLLESLCHQKSLHFTIPTQPLSDKNSLVNCNNPLVALLTYGQHLHNYHHEFPHDYRASQLTWAFDPTKWFIWTCSKLGLADELCRTPGNLVAQLEIQQQQYVLNRMRSQLNWGTPISKLPVISIDEFRRLAENNQNRIYIVIQNIIHDITPFMDQHPGGPALLQASHGKDATKAFYGGVYGHSTAAVNLLATMRIGVTGGNDEDVWRRAVTEEGERGDSVKKTDAYRTAEAA